MDLTDRQKDALAEYLAERLVGFATRRATAEAAGMSDAQVAGEPVRSWRLLIDEALERGRFQQLVKSAARQSLGDTGLETLAHSVERGELILPEPPRPPPPWRILVIGMVGAMVIVAVAVAGAQLFAVWQRMPHHLQTSPAQEAPPSTSIEETPHLTVRQGVAPEPAPRRPVPAAAPEPAPAPEPAEPDYQPPPGRYIKVVGPPSPEPAPSGDPGRCTGYAFVGNTRPDVAGGKWTPSTAVNVRAWYPRKDNQYDASGRVVCVLPGGSAVPAGDPIQVPGGAWWIPIQGGP